MAFHIQTHDFPPIRCYSDAHQYWERIKPWRGYSPTDAKPLAGRKAHHMTIRKLNDGSIAMRLHHTDVVTYHPDNSITIEGYASVSTDAFARALLPSGLSASFNNGVGFMVHTTVTRLMADKTITMRRVDGEWQATDPAMLTPFVKYSVDRKKANAALKKYEFSDFEAWIKARKAFDKDARRGYFSAQYDRRYVEVLTALREKGESWDHLYKHHAVAAIDYVRNAIYNAEEVIVKTELDCVADWRGVQAVAASQRKWAHMCG